GGTDPRRAEEIVGYRPLIAAAMAGFRGTVISGGTLQGVCGMVGEAGASSGRVRTIGYLPGNLPPDAGVDDRYDELRLTTGDGFSPLDPLQNWIDLIASGIDPAEVVVLGLGGGQIAAAEYRIALALGARVGIVVGSGREASRLLSDPRWNNATGLVPLPADPHTIRAFVASPSPGMDGIAREALAREMHRSYREEISATRAEDPAQRPWESLADDLKQSNLSQADDIVAKVEAIGCRVRPAGTATGEFAFTVEEAELLAEMEHGRWNADRLRSGWRWGPGRDADAKASPYLVPWTQVPDEIRDYDREFVRRIPALLASVGLEIVREG
ncbi:MAG: RyR domain-containing protein, partial [Acidimicrobiia bacterium]|nr:RyR domain-containing protein [Acidimicrobiia bacterium]